MKSAFPLVFAWAVLTTGVVQAADRVGDWWVTMPAELLKGMSASERTCADRALKQLDGNGARAAANEFKRFNSEFLTTASEETLAWASFFQAYSLDKAKDRFKAVDLYSETIELYPDSMAACAALFFRARSQADNGQVLKALSDYRALTDNASFAKHPLVYAAYNSLGWGELKAGRFKEAKAAWQAVRDLPREGNRTEWNSVNATLAVLEALADPQGTMAQAAGDESVPQDKRRERLRNWRNGVWNEVWGNRPVVEAYFRENLGKAKDVRSAEMAYLGKMSSAFVKFAGPVFKATPDGEWELANLEFDTIAALAPKNLGKMIDRLAGELRKTADASVRSERAGAFIGKLRDANRIAEAKLLLDCITDPVQRAWTAVSLGWRARDGQYVIEQLAPLEALPDAMEADKAKRDHARCCQELLKDYEAAIALYEAAPSPPSTLWAVANCHRAAGRLTKAQATLDELCSVFPKDAAQAMLQKGDWYREAGDRKNAIGCYRRILGHADWKKSGAASQAHQRLEAFGIATGGAVVNEVH